MIAEGFAPGWELEFDDYHAHVYFDEEQFAMASDLCDMAGELFGVKVGRKHRRPVGPHPLWSCQLAFSQEQARDLIAWLDENRLGLTVLIHPLSGDDLRDHSVHARWLGQSQELKLDMFR